MLFDENNKLLKTFLSSQMVRTICTFGPWFACASFNGKETLIFDDVNENQNVLDFVECL